MERGNHLAKLALKRIWEGLHREALGKAPCHGHILRIRREVADLAPGITQTPRGSSKESLMPPFRHGFSINWAKLSAL